MSLEEGGQRVKLRYPKESVQFVFDTGAHVTSIEMGLADQLKLELDLGVEQVIQVRGSLPVYRAQIDIRLGDRWESIDCAVPCERDLSAENLLGMLGLLSKYVFVLSSDELAVFDRPGTE